MEAQWLQSLVDWVQAHPNWAGLIIFLIAFGESLLLVGILLPGAAILFGLGTLVGLGVLDFQTAWLWSTLGAIVGDGLSFWIGHHYHEKLLSMWPVNRFPKLVEKGREFFRKYGSMSVFLGRFVGPVRPIIPAIAGMMDMSVKRYILVNIIASILWAPVYILPGVFLSQSLKATAQVAGKLAILAAALVALVWFAWWLISHLYRWLIPYAYRLLSRTLLWSQRHPLLGKLTAALVDPRKPESGSLATLAAALLVLTGLSTWALLSSDTLNAWNRQLGEFLQAFHTPWTVPPMKILLALGHDAAIAAPFLAVLGWLLYRRRLTAAWHWLAAGLFGWLLSLVLAHWGGQTPAGWGFSHLAWLTSVLAFLAVLVSGALPVRLRSWPYVLAAIEVALVAFAALFFQQLTLAQVLVSIFIGSLWAFIVGVAYRTRNRRQFWGLPIAIIFYSVHLAVASVIWLGVASPVPETRSLSAVTISTEQWLHGVDRYEKKRTDWMNRAREDLNIHYAGDLHILQQVLAANGWQAVPVRTWGGLLQALSATATDERPSPAASDDTETGSRGARAEQQAGKAQAMATELPILASTNHGQVEALLMKKRLPNGDWQVLHLWPEAVRLAPAGLPVYSGEILRHRPMALWKLFHFLGVADHQPLDTAELDQALAASGRFIRLETKSGVSHWQQRGAQPVRKPVR
jgi:membrane protein DedA with SNARE-associated domain